MNWRPGAGVTALRARAELLDCIRGFFRERNVLEVETPLLARYAVTDPHIEVPRAAACGETRFLQSSPEYAMKRLLAAGSGPIYQVCKAFREGETGRRHNPEFTLLEWYRPGYDHHRLMEEVAQLIAHCHLDLPVRAVTYRDLFLQMLDVDPMTAGAGELEALAHRRLDTTLRDADSDTWLELLMTHLIEPELGRGEMCFVYDYPASQAALARLAHTDGLPVGQRFELYIDGLELANGYNELADPAEQRRRFDTDNAQRRAAGVVELAPDERLLAALECGLPACSGVALGLDRLLMLIIGAGSLSEVLAFDWSRA